MFIGGGGGGEKNLILYQTHKILSIGYELFFEKFLKKYFYPFCSLMRIVAENQELVKKLFKI